MALRLANSDTLLKHPPTRAWPGARVIDAIWSGMNGRAPRLKKGAGHDAVSGRSLRPAEAVAGVHFVVEKQRMHRACTLP